MEQEVNVEEVLKNMRDWAGVLVQENAILKAQLQKALEKSSTTN